MTILILCYETRDGQKCSYDDDDDINDDDNDDSYCNKLYFLSGEHKINTRITDTLLCQEHKLRDSAFVTLYLDCILFKVIPC